MSELTFKPEAASRETGDRLIGVRTLDDAAAPGAADRRRFTPVAGVLSCMSCRENYRFRTCTNPAPGPKARPAPKASPPL